MGVDITYKGTSIAAMEDSGTKTLKTAGKYCEDDITVEFTGGSEGVYVLGSSPAYEQIVPAMANPVATLNSIGGRSQKWNQLAKVSGFNRGAIGGVTISTYGKNDLVLNGTATSNVSCAAAIFSSMSTHAILIMGCPPGGSDTTYFFDNYGGSRIRDYGDGAIITTGLQYARLMIVSGVTVSNFIFRPRVIDLTEIFGEGNEPVDIFDPRVVELKRMAEALPMFDSGSWKHADCSYLSSRDMTFNIPFLSVDAWSVGDVCNERNFKLGKRIQRVGLDEDGTPYILDDPIETPLDYPPIEFYVMDSGTVTFNNSFGLAVPNETVYQVNLDTLKSQIAELYDNDVKEIKNL